MTTLAPEWLAWPETKRLVKAFADGGAPLRFVGGAVRDALLGRPVTDVDAATPLLPEATMALLEKSGIRAIPTGIAHGTVTALIDKKSFEITTLRKDIATDGRHATVAYSEDWKEDAARRDFTMNALYLSPAGELFDYFAGADDAKAGQVRFIGEADARIREDYLRILRFFRFYAWYGKGEPDEAALSACRALAGGMGALSGERIQQELLKLLAALGCYRTLDIMRDEHILLPLLGFGLRDLAMAQRFDAIAEAISAAILPTLKLALFFLKADIPADVALDRLSERLKLSGATTKALQTVLLHRDEISPHMNEAAQKKILRHLGAERFKQAVIVQWAYDRDFITPTHPYAALLKLADTWQPPLFPVSGDDLIAHGIKPGKDMGELLGRLEEAWEKSGYALNKKALLKQV